VLLDELTETAFLEQSEHAAVGIEDVDAGRHIAENIVGCGPDAKRPDPARGALEARKQREIRIVEGGAAAHIRPDQAPARRPELRAELKRRVALKIVSRSPPASRSPAHGAMRSMPSMRC